MGLFLLLICVQPVTGTPTPYPALDPDLKTQITPLFVGKESFNARLEAIKNEHPDRDPLGLLLSGGSARAYAHIGVLRRLEEAGIVPDFIVANSMGAIVALLYSAGFAPDDIERIITITPLEKLFKPVVPLHGGILDPGYFADIMAELFGDTELENLSIPTLIICDDLASKRQVWLAEGPLVDTFLAAFSMPLYFPPVRIGELRLVDGGTSNLIPAAIPAHFSPRFIIAATFYEGKGLNFNNPITIINRNFSTSKERAAIRDIEKEGGFLIRCAVEDFSFMDFGQIDRIVEAGYQTTDERIPSLLEHIGENAVNRSSLYAQRRNKLLETEKTLSLGRQIRHHHSRFNIAAGLTLPNSFNAPFLLEPESSIDLMMKIESGFMTAELGGWTSIERFGAGASAHLAFAPPGPLSMETSLSWCPEWSWIQGRITANGYLGENLILEGTAGAEFLATPTYFISDQIMQAGVSVRPRAQGCRLYPQLRMGGFLRSEDEAPYTMGIESQGSGVLRIAGPLEVRLGYLARWSPTYRLFSPFPSDPWRGPVTGPVRLPQLWTNGEIALAFRETGISLAESLQIPRIDVALYTDTLLSYDDWKFASGLSVTATASLIGLSSLSATLYGGRDWRENTFYWALRLGLLWK